MNNSENTVITMRRLLTSYLPCYLHLHFLLQQNHVQQQRYKMKTRVNIDVAFLDWRQFFGSKGLKSGEEQREESVLLTLLMQLML